MVVSVAAVSERVIQNALDLAWGDFEDSVQYSEPVFTTDERRLSGLFPAILRRFSLPYVV